MMWREPFVYRKRYPAEPTWLPWRRYLSSRVPFRGDAILSKKNIAGVQSSLGAAFCDRQELQTLYSSCAVPRDDALASSVPSSHTPDPCRWYFSRSINVMSFVIDFTHYRDRRNYLKSYLHTSHCSLPPDDVPSFVVNTSKGDGPYHDGCLKGVPQIHRTSTWCTTRLGLTACNLYPVGCIQQCICASESYEWKNILVHSPGRPRHAWFQHALQCHHLYMFSDRFHFWQCLQHPDEKIRRDRFSSWQVAISQQCVRPDIVSMIRHIHLEHIVHWLIPFLFWIHTRKFDPRAALLLDGFAVKIRKCARRGLEEYLAPKSASFFSMASYGTWIHVEGLSLYRPISQSGFQDTKH